MWQPAREPGAALFLLRARRGAVPGLPALPREVADAVLARAREVACAACGAAVLVDEVTSLVPRGTCAWLHASPAGVLTAMTSPDLRMRVRLASAAPAPAGFRQLPLDEWTHVAGGARGYAAGGLAYADAAPEMRQTRRFWRLDGHAVCERCLLRRRAARRALRTWAEKMGRG